MAVRRRTDTETGRTTVRSWAAMWFQGPPYFNLANKVVCKIKTKYYICKPKVGKTTQLIYGL